jgi:hypothetical protein
MRQIKHIGHRAWSYVSLKSILSAVMAGLILGGIAAAPRAVSWLEPAPPPMVPIEQAKMKGGTSSPARVLYRCDTDDRCIEADRVTFDSTIGEPLYGDERYFLRSAVLGTGHTVSPERNVVVQPGDRVLVVALIHNDAHDLTALHTRFRVSLPANGARVLPIGGSIESANSAPRTVNDATFLRSKTPFEIDYVAGSAHLLSLAAKSSYPISDNVIGEGVPIGYERPNGIFPGCACDIGLLTFEVSVVSSDEVPGEEAVTSLK